MSRHFTSTIVKDIVSELLTFSFINISHNLSRMVYFRKIFSSLNMVINLWVFSFYIVRVYPFYNWITTRHFKIPLSNKSFGHTKIFGLFDPSLSNETTQSTELFWSVFGKHSCLFPCDGNYIQDRQFFFLRVSTSVFFRSLGLSFKGKRHPWIITVLGLSFE